MTIAGCLGSTEWQMYFRTNRRRVDIRDAGVEIANRRERFVHIPGIERRRQAVLDAVGDFNRGLQPVARNDRDHGAKDLFLGDAHLRINVGEHGWLHKVAVLIVALVEAVAAADHLRAFLFADLDIAEIGGELAFVDRGPHLDRWIESVADLQFLRLRHIAVNKFLINTLLHDDAAGRGAALPRGAERAPEPAFNGEIEIRIVEHDHRVLAAEFQRTVFEALRRGRAHNASHCR